MIDVLARRTRPTAFATTARAALALGIALAAVLLLAPAFPATAHSELTGSSPADGEQLASPPDSLTLEFNENIQDLGTEVVVTAAGSDVSVVDGDPVVDGPEVEVPLTLTEAGDYDVAWRVVSADGHPISGELGFGVEEATGSAADPTGSAESTESAATAEPTETTSGAGAETSAAGGADATTEPAGQDPTDAADVGAADEGSDPAPVVIGIVAAVVVVLAVVLGVRHRLARRERP